MGSFDRYAREGGAIRSRSALKRSFDKNTSATNNEINKILKTLNTIPAAYRVKERKKVLRKAAEPLVQAARQNVTHKRLPAKGYHLRYIGNGQTVRYYPGNLAKSIRKLSFRRSPDIHVGPKVARRRGGDEYGKTSRTVDAYYAGMVEFGTINFSGQSYLRRAYDSTKQDVLRACFRGMLEILGKWKRKNEIP